METCLTQYKNKTLKGINGRRERVEWCEGEKKHREGCGGWGNELVEGQGRNGTPAPPPLTATPCTLPTPQLRWPPVSSLLNASEGRYLIWVCLCVCMNYEVKGICFDWIYSKANEGKWVKVVIGVLGAVWFEKGDTAAPPLFESGVRFANRFSSL